ncbi:MAG: leucine-rich repeat domain-containing protein [Oscillospiraceae bacterium]|nr:leucine-rich repeat domain-containing protein [Oscillospiraceae bacterium]
MKRIIYIFILCFCASLLLGPLIIPAETRGPRAGAACVYDVRLPNSLVRIGDSAFEDTAVESVYLPAMTTVIGSRAFAANSALRAVFIPEAVLYIGERAFEGDQLTIYGAKDSYAAAWAQSHNVAFVQEQTTLSWIDLIRKLLRENAFVLVSLGCLSPAVFPQLKRTGRRERSMRPQDRPELYPIDYRFP